MKQKLKQNLDKIKKPSLTKCVKMSNDEIENIKNGIINGDSLINIQHQRELQSKLKNSNSNQDIEIVGGRLKFYKDGKFILELARSREGDKSGWISVPRKTFWPPTITSNPGIIQSHDSSTPVSLIADSDNNSSIPSSPWQRDNYRKSSHPRRCSSNELSFIFYRPRSLILSESPIKLKKHRRPFIDNGSKIKFITKIKDEEDDVVGDDGVEKMQTQTTSPTKGRLIDIVKKLTEKLSSATITVSQTTPTTQSALNGNSRNVQSSKTYSLANHIASAINSQPHQHVSPRKRILRELEKVSLEDIKCSRPKTINGNSSSITSSTTSSPMPPVSRPISSYSITSLLAHKTNNNNNNNGDNNTKNNTSNNHHHNNNNSNNNNNNNINNNNDHLSDSTASQSEKSSASLSQQHSPSSDSPMHPHQMRTPPSSNGNSLHSPQQNSDHAHHAFHKYHPVTTRGSPSPSQGADSLSNHSLRTTANFSPSLNYSIRESSSSPNTEKSSSSNRNTPPSTGRTIRTLPKKTAALRQQFSSPTMEKETQQNQQQQQPTPMITNEREKAEVEQIYKPSAFVSPHLAYHPQMYPSINYLSQAMPPFYPASPFYDPAMMAVAAAAYRFPTGMQPGIPLGYPGSLWPMSPAQFPGPMPTPSMIQNEQRHSPSHQTPTQFKSSYVPNSPWNPNLTSNHPLIDKRESIEKSENEANSDVPLNLSKH